MHKLLVARIGKRFSGWLTRDLSDVRPTPVIHPLPEPFPHIRGSAFVGGRLITVIDTFSVMGEEGSSPEDGVLLRLAPPNDHLAFHIRSAEAVLPFTELNLHEENASGIWAGLYPWEEAWISVINPSAVAAELSRAATEAIHHLSTGRDHAS